MIVWYAGMVAVIPPMAGMGAIRATGDSRFQSRLLIVASAVNLILDPLLIFGWVAVTSLAVWAALNAAFGLRVSEDEESEGVDIGECGIEAYPEFVKG